MTTPSFATEVAGAPNYPTLRFGARERKMLQSVSIFMGWRLVGAGNFTTLGGDANEAITVSGALSTDVAIVTLKTAGAVARTITTAAAATGQINVVLSGDPSTDHVLNYILIRAV